MMSPWRGSKALYEKEQQSAALQKSLGLAKVGLDDFVGLCWKGRRRE